MAPKSETDEPSVSDDTPAKEERFKWPEPPLFHGDKRKDVVTVHDWVELMHEHVLLRKMNVQSTQALRFARLHLRGQALTWSRSYSGKQSFGAFTEALTAAVAPFAEQYLNRDRLKRLYQRDHLQGYIDLFRAQALLVKDMSDADKVDLFVSNLKQYLRGPVRLHMIDKPKDQLDLAMQVASEISYELRKDRRASDSRGPPPTPSKLSTAQSPPVRKCYKCGSTEHLRANCPQVRKGRGGGNRHGNKAQARAASAQASENA
jgi:hypothetical protein